MCNKAWARTLVQLSQHHQHLMDTTAPSFQSVKDFSLEGSSEKFVKWCRPWWIWVQGLPSQPWALEQISFMVYFCWLGSYTLFDSNRHVDWHTSRSSPKLSRKKPCREKNEKSETEELWSLSNPFSNKHWLLFSHEWMPMPSAISGNNHISHLQAIRSVKGVLGSILVIWGLQKTCTFVCVVTSPLYTSPLKIY